MKLETLDINSAKLLRETEDMLKLILQDRFRKITSGEEQKKNENIQYVFSDVKEQEVNYINEDIQDECSNDSELTLQDKFDDYSYDMDLSFTDSSVYSDRCQSVLHSTPIELSDSMYDYESKDKMELINSKKQEVQRNIKRAKNFIDSDDSDDSSILNNTNILKSS